MSYKEALQLWIWGWGADGQLAQNNTNKYSSPVQVGTSTDWEKIFSTSGNYNAYYGIKNDGTMWSWGENDNYGLVGNDSSANVSSPIQLPGTNWKAAFGGRNAVIASKTDGTLWAWGNNPAGQLGQNDRSSAASPKQIGTGTDWTGTTAAIAQGQGMSGAIKTDGTLWTWGDGGSGNLGLNDRIKYSSPTQVPGTNWNDVKIGNATLLATKTDGTLWASGTNYKGLLGQNSTSTGYYSSPVQIPGTTWRSVGGLTWAGYAAWALKDDNTMWSWGAGFYGATGHNNKTDYSSPTQIGTDTTWENYSTGNCPGAGEPNMIAVKTDGTLWTWGANVGDYKGGLGLNDIISRSSPTQVGTSTNWSTTRGAITATGGGMAAIRKP